MTTGDHQHLLPREGEQLTLDHLDTLLDQVVTVRFDPAVSLRLICHMLATLISGFGEPPQPISRARSDDSTSTSDIRWLQLAFGDEIDRVLILLWADPAPACHYCLQQWSLHLLHARAILKAWAWVRETESRIRCEN